MKRRATQERNEFFARRFGEALKEKHLRQTDFIRLYEQITREELHTNTVSKWVRGINYPEARIFNICKVLEVDESYFTPTTEVDRYFYDTETQNAIGEYLFRYATKRGLNCLFCMQ